jgi:hypothetical protein
MHFVGRFFNLPDQGPLAQCVKLRGFGGWSPRVRSGAGVPEAALNSGGIAMFFTIIALVSLPCGVPQVCGEFGGDRVITDVSRC